MNKFKTNPLLTALTALSLSVVGCAHEPSSELVTARNAYDKLVNGPAQGKVPEEMYEARKALNAAERAHERDADSKETKDLAYIAARQSQIAYAKYERQQAEQKAKAAEDAQLAALNDQRKRAVESLEATRSALAVESKALEDREAKLAAIREERELLQDQLSDALSELAEAAKVSQQSDRTVLTLNGSVLFAVDRADLLPTAHERLSEVAQVLDKYDDKHRIVIEGHTDATGSAAYNARLSQRRAEAVRNFLVSRSVDPAAVQAIGKGESEPIASNATPEDRAHNRRVEISIQRINS